MPISLRYMRTGSLVGVLTDRSSLGMASSSALASAPSPGTTPSPSRMSMPLSAKMLKMLSIWSGVSSTSCRASATWSPARYPCSRPSSTSTRTSSMASSADSAASVALFCGFAQVVRPLAFVRLFVHRVRRGWRHAAAVRRTAGWPALRSAVPVASFCTVSLSLAMSLPTCASCRRRNSSSTTLAVKCSRPARTTISASTSPPLGRQRRRPPPPGVVSPRPSSSNRCFTEPSASRISARGEEAFVDPRQHSAALVRLRQTTGEEAHFELVDAADGGRPPAALRRLAAALCGGFSALHGAPAPRKQVAHALGRELQPVGDMPQLLVALDRRRRLGEDPPELCECACPSVGLVEVVGRERQADVEL